MLLYIPQVPDYTGAALQEHQPGIFQRDPGHTRLDDECYPYGLGHKSSLQYGRANGAAYGAYRRRDRGQGTPSVAAIFCNYCIYLLHLLYLIHLMRLLCIIMSVFSELVERNIPTAM